MFNEKMMDKLKSKKGKSKMHDMHKDAKLDVLKDLSKQAGDAMSVKIMAKPSDMPEAIDTAKDKVEDIIKDMHMPDGDEDLEGYDKNDEEFEEEFEEEEYEEDEGEEMYAESPDLGEDLEGQVEDYSNVSPDELDERIEKLLKIREKMKVASMD